MESGMDIENEDRKSNDLKKYNGAKRVPRKYSNASLSPVFPAKNTNSHQSIDCAKVEDRSGIQYDDDIIELNEGSLDIIDIDSSNTKKVLNDGMKLTNDKKSGRRRKSISHTPAEKTLLKIVEKNSSLTDGNRESLPTPLQAFADEMMKENKNSSTIPVQIKVNNKDWTVNVSKTVVSQSKSSCEFPRNRDALFKALKEESYRLLKLVSKKNSIRNDVRMVFDPKESRITPFHINFKMQESFPDRVVHDDGLDMSKFISSDVEDSEEEGAHNDDMVYDAKGINITDTDTSVQMSDNNFPSCSEKRISVSNSNEFEIDDQEELQNHNVNLLQVESNEEGTSRWHQSSTERVSHLAIQQSEINSENIDSNEQHHNEVILSVSYESENIIKEEIISNVQCDDPLQSNGMPRISRMNDQLVNIVIKQESNQNSEMGRNDIPYDDQLDVEGTGNESLKEEIEQYMYVDKNSNHPLDSLAVIPTEVTMVEEDDESSTISENHNKTNNKFESEYIIPDIDFVDNTSFKSSNEKISYSDSFSEGGSNSSDDHASEYDNNEVLSEDEVSEVHDMSQNVEFITGLKSNEEIVMLSSLPSSSFHCLDSGNKVSDQSVEMEKDPLYVEEFNEGFLFYDPETDYDDSKLHHSGTKNESDTLDNMSGEEVGFSNEKNNHCLDNFDHGVRYEQESHGENSDDFNLSNKWNWSNLRKYNSKAVKNNSMKKGNLQCAVEQNNQKQVEDEKFIGFSDLADSSSKYSEFVTACSRLGYYDEMVILNQHYEVSQPNKRGWKLQEVGASTSMLSSNEKKIANGDLNGSSSAKKKYSHLSRAKSDETKKGFPQISKENVATNKNHDHELKDDQDGLFFGFGSNDNYTKLRKNSIEISRRLSEDFSCNKNEVIDSCFASTHYSGSETEQNFSGNVVKERKKLKNNVRQQKFEIPVSSNRNSKFKCESGTEEVETICNETENRKQCTNQSISSTPNSSSRNKNDQYCDRSLISRSDIDSSSEKNISILSTESLKKKRGRPKKNQVLFSTSTPTSATSNVFNSPNTSSDQKIVNYNSEIFNKSVENISDLTSIENNSLSEKGEHSSVAANFCSFTVLAPKRRGRPRKIFADIGPSKIPTVKQTSICPTEDDKLLSKLENENDTEIECLTGAESVCNSNSSVEYRSEKGYAQSIKNVSINPSLQDQHRDKHIYIEKTTDNLKAERNKINLEQNENKKWCDGRMSPSHMDKQRTNPYNDNVSSVPESGIKKESDDLIYAGKTCRDLPCPDEVSVYCFDGLQKDQVAGIPDSPSDVGGIKVEANHNHEEASITNEMLQTNNCSQVEAGTYPEHAGPVPKRKGKPQQIHHTEESIANEHDGVGKETNRSDTTNCINVEGETKTSVCIADKNNSHHEVEANHFSLIPVDSMQTQVDCLESSHNRKTETLPGPGKTLKYISLDKEEIDHCQKTINNILKSNELGNVIKEQNDGKGSSDLAAGKAVDCSENIPKRKPGRPPRKNSSIYLYKKENHSFEVDIIDGNNTNVLLNTNEFNNTSEQKYSSDLAVYKAEDEIKTCLDCSENVPKRKPGRPRKNSLNHFHKKEIDANEVDEKNTNGLLNTIEFNNTPKGKDISYLTACKAEDEIKTSVDGSENIPKKKPGRPPRKNSLNHFHKKESDTNEFNNTPGEKDISDLTTCKVVDEIKTSVDGSENIPKRKPGRPPRKNSLNHIHKKENDSNDIDVIDGKNTIGLLNTNEFNNTPKGKNISDLAACKVEDEIKTSVDGSENIPKRKPGRLPKKNSLNHFFKKENHRFEVEVIGGKNTNGMLNTNESNNRDEGNTCLHKVPLKKEHNIDSKVEFSEHIPNRELGQAMEGILKCLHDREDSRCEVEILADKKNNDVNDKDGEPIIGNDCSDKVPLITENTIKTPVEQPEPSQKTIPGQPCKDSLYSSSNKEDCKSVVKISIFNGKKTDEELNSNEGRDKDEENNVTNVNPDLVSGTNIASSRSSPSQSQKFSFNLLNDKEDNSQDDIKNQGNRRNEESKSNEVSNEIHKIKIGNGMCQEFAETKKERKTVMESLKIVLKENPGNTKEISVVPVINKDGDKCEIGIIDCKNNKELLMSNEFSNNKNEQIEGNVDMDSVPLTVEDITKCDTDFSKEVASRTPGSPKRGDFMSVCIKYEGENKPLAEVVPPISSSQYEKENSFSCNSVKDIEILDMKANNIQNTKLLIENTKPSSGFSHIENIHKPVNEELTAEISFNLESNSSSKIIIADGDSSINKNEIVNVSEQNIDLVECSPPSPLLHNCGSLKKLPRMSSQSLNCVDVNHSNQTENISTNVHKPAMVSNDDNCNIFSNMLKSSNCDSNEEKSDANLKKRNSFCKEHVLSHLSTKKKELIGNQFDCLEFPPKRKCDKPERADSSFTEKMEQGIKPFENEKQSVTDQNTLKSDKSNVVPYGTCTLISDRSSDIPDGEKDVNISPAKNENPGVSLLQKITNLPYKKRGHKRKASTSCDNSFSDSEKSIITNVNKTNYKNSNANIETLDEFNNLLPNEKQASQKNGLTAEKNNLFKQEALAKNVCNENSNCKFGVITTVPEGQCLTDVRLNEEPYLSSSPTSLKIEKVPHHAKNQPCGLLNQYSATEMEKMNSLSDTEIISSNSSCNNLEEQIPPQKLTHISCSSENNDSCNVGDISSAAVLNSMDLIDTQVNCLEPILSSRHLRPENVSLEPQIKRKPGRPPKRKSVHSIQIEKAIVKRQLISNIDNGESVNSNILSGSVSIKGSESFQKLPEEVDQNKSVSEIYVEDKKTEGVPNSIDMNYKNKEILNDILSRAPLEANKMINTQILNIKDENNPQNITVDCGNKDQLQNSNEESVEIGGIDISHQIPVKSVEIIKKSMVSSELIPKRMPGRPKKVSLIHLHTKFKDNSFGDIIDGRNTDEVLDANDFRNKDEELKEGNYNLVSASLKIEEMDKTPDKGTEPSQKKKPGRPKKISLNNLHSKDDKSQGEVFFLDHKNRNGVSCSNELSNKTQEIRKENNISQESLGAEEIIETAIESSKTVKRKPGRPKKVSLNLLTDKEDRKSVETFGSKMTNEILNSNVFSDINKELHQEKGDSARPQPKIERMITAVKSCEPLLKKKRGRPSKVSLNPLNTNEGGKTETEIIDGMNTKKVLSPNGFKYEEGEQNKGNDDSDLISFKVEETVNDGMNSSEPLSNRKPLPLRTKDEVKVKDEITYNGSEVDGMPNSSNDSSNNPLNQESNGICSRDSIKAEDIIKSEIDCAEPTPKRRPGRPRKNRVPLSYNDEVAFKGETGNQSRKTNEEINNTSRIQSLSDRSDGFSLDSVEAEKVALPPTASSEPVLKRKRGRPKKVLLITTSTPVDCNSRRSMRMKRDTSFLDSEFIEISYDDGKYINENSVLDVSLSDESTPSLPKKRRGRKKGFKVKKDIDMENEDLNCLYTNYITYSNEGIKLETLEQNSEKNNDNAFDFNISPTRDNSSLEESKNKLELTSKQLARLTKKKSLSGRVDTSTRLRRPNDMVKCAVCGELMTVKDYQKIHLVKHNFISWLEGEEPLPVDDFDSMDVVLTRGKRAYPRLFFKCEICGHEKKSSKGFLSHRQICGKTDKERQNMLQPCIHCGRLLMPSSLPPHLYQYHRAQTEAVQQEEPLGPVRKAAARCLGKIASYIEDEVSAVNADDFQQDVDGDEEFDEIEEISLLYVPIQKKKLTKHLLERWKLLVSENKEIPCYLPTCDFKTYSFNSILEHHKSCISGDCQGYSCIKCNYLCKIEDEMREHVKSCNPPIIVSQSEDSESEEHEKNVVIPYLKTAEQSLVYQRIRCHFFKPALKWMKQIYETYFSKEVLFHEFELNLDLWKELDALTSKFYNPELSESMKISYQNSSWENLHTFEGKVLEGDQGLGFTGGPIWAMEWCPGEGDQYLAVSSHLKMETNFEAGSTFTGPGLVQLWSLEDIVNSRNVPFTTLQFSYGICHNERSCWSMAWCPSGARTENRIGLLALATTSGSIPVYAMPNPQCLLSQSTRFYKPEPVLKLELWSNERWQCYSISWSKVKPHTIIAAGFVNGIVAIWDLSTKSKLLRNKNILHPFKVFQAHHSIITGVCLSPESDSYLATASYDKSFKYWDLNDTTAPQSVLKRGLFTSVGWLRHWMSAVTTYDNAYTMLQTSVSLNSIRSFVAPTMQIVTSVNSTSWSVSVNDWLNGAVTSYDNGQVVLFFALKQTYYQHLDKRKYTKVLLQSALHNFESHPNEALPKENNMPSNSYGDAVKKYGLAIKTDLAIGKYDKLSEKGTESMNDIYPLSSINRIAWNNNRQSFLYVAMGYQSGFIVVSKLSMPNIDQALIDEVSKSE